MGSYPTPPERKVIATQLRDQFLETKQMLGAGLARRGRLVDRYRFGNVPDGLRATGLGLVNDGQVDVPLEATVYLDLIHTCLRMAAHLLARQLGVPHATEIRGISGGSPSRIEAVVKISATTRSCLSALVAVCGWGIRKGLLPIGKSPAISGASRYSIFISGPSYHSGVL